MPLQYGKQRTSISLHALWDNCAILMLHDQNGVFSFCMSLPALVHLVSFTTNVHEIVKIKKMATHRGLWYTLIRSLFYYSNQLTFNIFYLHTVCVVETYMQYMYCFYHKSVSSMLFYY